jgi:hypothetical protein
LLAFWPPGTSPGSTARRPRRNAIKVSRIFLTAHLNGGFVDVTYLSYQAAGRSVVAEIKIWSLRPAGVRQVPKANLLGPSRLFFTFWRFVCFEKFWLA